MHKILFLNDFSDNAAVAYRYAAYLAEAFGAVLCQASCNAQAVLPLHRSPEDVGQLIMELEAFSAGLGYSGAVESLDVWLEDAGATCQLAEDIRAGLIVVPESAPYTQALARQLARASDLPLLLVPATAVFQPFHKIVFALSFQFNDLIALNVLRRWVQTLEAKLDVVHVLEKDSGAVQAAEKMGALAEMLGAAMPYAFQLLQGRHAKQAVLDYLSRSGGGLLVLTTHRKSAWEAFFERGTSGWILEACQVPLLLIKDSEGG
jgi:nucleotide-binding universal stress UspA family protein